MLIRIILVFFTISLPTLLQAQNQPQSNQYERLRTLIAQTNDIGLTSSAVRGFNKKLLSLAPDILAQDFMIRSAKIAAQEPSFHAYIQNYNFSSYLVWSLERDQSSVMRLPGAQDALLKTVKQNLIETNYSDALAQYLDEYLRGHKISFPTFAQNIPRPRKRLLTKQAADTNKELFFRKGSPNKPSAAERIILLATMYHLGEEAFSEGMRHRWSQAQDIQLCNQLALDNLSQCLAASYDLGEEVFCTSTHGIRELNRCFRWLGRK